MPFDIGEVYENVRIFIAMKGIKLLDIWLLINYRKL